MYAKASQRLRVETAGILAQKRLASKAVNHDNINAGFDASTGFLACFQYVRDRVMKFRTWAVAVALVVLLLEGRLLAVHGNYPSCPYGERIRMAMPFEKIGGQAWTVSFPELEVLADNGSENQSPIAICEENWALGPAHASLRDITEKGKGRFSHWRSDLVFSPSDDSDPNTNGRSYLAIRTAAIPLSGSTARPKPVTSKVGILTDPNKRTLYTFDKDSPDKSACNDICAEVWPPYTDQVELYDPATNSAWTTITRNDRKTMWAYKGKPVYLFIGDKDPEDTKGDGIDGVWHAAKQ